MQIQKTIYHHQLFHVRDTVCLSALSSMTFSGHTSEKNEDIPLLDCSLRWGIQVAVPSLQTLFCSTQQILVELS